MELSHWSRSFPDADVSRYDELAQRRVEPRKAVADQFQNEDRAGELAKAIGGEAAQPEAAERLRTRSSRCWRRSVCSSTICATGPTSLSRLGRGLRPARCVVDGFPAPRRDRERLLRHVIHEGSGRAELKAVPRLRQKGERPSARSACCATGSG